MQARIWLLFALALLPRTVHAETSVPIDLQVDLVTKLVRFERNFVDRAGPEVRLIVVVRVSNASSTRAAAQIQLAFERVREIAGKPVRVLTVTFTSTAALKSAALGDRAQLLFITPGFDAEIESIASAFSGQPIITVTTDGDQVAHGIVIGFELVSSKPKISLNLGQARRQALDFNSDLFRLAKVIQ